jgi:hypothetical protein
MAKDNRFNRKLYTIDIRILQRATHQGHDFWIVRKTRTASFYGIKLVNRIFNMAFALLCAWNTIGEPHKKGDRRPKNN